MTDGVGQVGFWTVGKAVVVMALASTHLNTIISDFWKTDRFVLERPVVKENYEQSSQVGHYGQSFYYYADHDKYALRFPSGLALTHTQLVIADTENHRIKIMHIRRGGPTLKFFPLFDIGELGQKDGDFIAPIALAMDHNKNHFLVLDCAIPRVQIFDASTFTFISKFGEVGQGPGQFWNPRGITVDHASHIFIADTSNDRVEIFNPEGTWLRRLGSGKGPRAGQLAAPIGIAVDNIGNVFVAEELNDRIQVFDPMGKSIRIIGSRGCGPIQFLKPRGLTLGRGTIVIADTENNRIQILTREGLFLAHLTQSPSGSKTDSLLCLTRILLGGACAEKQFILLPFSNRFSSILLPVGSCPCFFVPHILLFLVGSVIHIFFCTKASIFG